MLVNKIKIITILINKTHLGSIVDNGYIHTMRENLKLVKPYLNKVPLRIPCQHFSVRKFLFRINYH